MKNDLRFLRLTFPRIESYKKGRKKCSRNKNRRPDNEHNDNERNDIQNALNCDTVLHKLFMKNQEPVYVKQFRIPEAHQSYLQDQIREWLKLGIIQPSTSRYNSPVFLVQKKDGSYRVVQDFRSLNSNTYVDKYSMKDVQECISEIGLAGSTIFTTLDLTSGFWQMALDPKSRPYTAFTVPGMGQFEWKVVSMGLASAPSAFQCLVELVVKGINNVVVYIEQHSKPGSSPHEVCRGVV